MLYMTESYIQLNSHNDGNGHEEIYLDITKTCPCRDCSSLKIENFQLKKKNDIFLIFAQNIDCGYTLEPPRRGGSRGGSNEYPQSMFWSKNKKNRYTSAYPSFAI